MSVARATAAAASALRERLDEAIRGAQDRALCRQHADGYWQAPLEACVGMDAQYVIFNRFMGRAPAETEQRLVANMLVRQAADGSWALYDGGPGHLSTTIEAYVAMKLAGVSATHSAMQRAREWILAQGGLAAAGVFTRFFLAYLGQYPWSALPAVPVELNLLPPWFPVSIYRFSSWARETLVPITILAAKRPRVPLAPGMDVGELWVRPPAHGDLVFPKGERLVSWQRFFWLVDRVLHRLGAIPWKPLRARALARAERWILEHQERDGGWGGIQPPMINCVMALRALGYPDEHPAVRTGIAAIESFVTEHDGRFFFQPCISPTWDTALMAKALLDSGVPGDHPALVRAADWLIDRQIHEPGDWSVYNPTLVPGGWAFEFENRWYPDVDDTAVILMGLIRMAASDPERRRRAIALGTQWAFGMQSRNGGFGAFDTDNDSRFLNEIPFADMKAMIDPPTEDLTGRLLELMGVSGHDLGAERARRAHAFVLRTQRDDGSWWGRWGANFIYGTWSVLAGLRAIGDDPEAPHVRRAVAWLKGRQNADGGWGETLASYDDESLAGVGPSTPSQTAWALLGLLAGERVVSAELLRGAEHLLDRQRPDGGWDEDGFTGTGFPSHFYLRYWMYRDYFPLMALGQLRARLAGTEALP